MVELWLVELDEAEAALQAEEARQSRLSDDDRSRIDALAAPDLRRQRRLSLIALRLLIAAALGTNRFDRVPFERAHAGKPRLPGAPLSFSMSHAHGRTLIAVAAAGPVEVDLEPARTLRMDARRKRALVHAAAALIPRASPDLAVSDHGEPDPGAVLQAWVRLEALAKAEGSGIGRLLTAAGIIGQRTRPSAADAPAEREGWADRYATAGVTVRDIALPRDTSGNRWFAAVAAHRDALGGAAPGLEVLAAADPAALRDIRSRIAPL